MANWKVSILLFGNGGCWQLQTLINLSNTQRKQRKSVGWNRSALVISLSVVKMQRQASILGTAMGGGSLVMIAYSILLPHSWKIGRRNWGSNSPLRSFWRATGSSLQEVKSGGRRQTTAPVAALRCVACLNCSWFTTLRQAQGHSIMQSTLENIFLKDHDERGPRRGRVEWWATADLNCRPRHYQCRALTS